MGRQNARFPATIELASIAASLLMAAWMVRDYDRDCRPLPKSAHEAKDFTTWKPWSPWVEDWWWTYNRLGSEGMLILSAVGAGLLWPTLRHLRARGRRAILAPGAAAILVGAGFQLVSTIGWALDDYLDPPTSGSPPVTRFVNTVLHVDASLVEAAIIGAWSWMGLAGAWRIRPGWVERAGRWYGFAWIACFLQSPLWAILWG